MNSKPVNKSFLVDGSDTINTSQSDLKKGFIQFSLENTVSMSWWKGIKIFDSQKNMISMIALQDHDHGPDSTKQFTTSQFGDIITIEIWKAKIFGVHTLIDTISFTKSDCDGKNTTLFWQND